MSKNTTKIREMYIRNPEIYEIGSGMKLFIYFFEFKVFRHKERETQFLSMLTFLSNPTTCGTPSQTTGLASENRLASSNSVFFFKSQNPQPVASGHDVIHIPSPISYLGILL